MQILSEILLQYIYNHNQFYILYCHNFHSLKVGGALANEIKHDHSPEVIVV